MRADHKQPAKIGIFGGSFDPIHNGHVSIAKAAMKQLKLDQILFIPTYRSPNKKHNKQSSAENRFSMIKIAITKYPEFKASEIEINRRGISYTIKTLREIKNIYHNPDIYLILGSDSAKTLQKWKKPEEIKQLAKIAIVKRRDFKSDSKKLRGVNPIMINTPFLPQSSTEIRKMIHKHVLIRRWIDPNVYNFILRQKLYM